MLFKRRERRHFHLHLREMIWPSMGWKRTLYYLHHRLFRQSDSTYRIAGGLATGAAVSFTPFLGTHFLQAIVYAHIFRQSKIASLIGTFWGNPWTLPPMFYLDYKLGAWMMKIIQPGSVTDIPSGQALSYFLSEPMDLFLPMAIGGVILGLLFWPLAYLILYYPTRKMRHAYHVRRALKLGIRKGRSHP